MHSASNDNCLSLLNDKTKNDLSFTDKNSLTVRLINQALTGPVMQQHRTFQRTDPLLRAARAVTDA
ncbi:hypothetical protein BG55_15035 [Erwinia mallotivora]|uniref:Uncharacterized protein n=1 Tax=Erwinia mallotivora TaxID=69222 RepID=A0A014PVZ8_9GAMM|nr:hypothetical protein BG55_15035 [Erwinia mallotivora]